MGLKSIDSNLANLVLCTEVSSLLVTHLGSTTGVITQELSQELLSTHSTNIQKATRLYTFFSKSKTDPEYEHLITGLTISGNTSALKILQGEAGTSSSASIQQQSVVLNTPKDQSLKTFIRSSDLALYFEESTNLSSKWSKFADALEIKPGSKAQAQKKVNDKESFYDIFHDFLSEWTGKHGRECTAKLLCHKLTDAGCKDIADAIQSISGISNDTVISSMTLRGYDKLEF